MTMAICWNMTINNPEPNDWALVERPHNDYIREICSTREIGEDGTEHLQCWFKLQKQQRMSFCKKLYPRGHFKPLTTAEYNLNANRYAQKNDETTAGIHKYTINDAIPDSVQFLRKMLAEAISTTLDHETIPETPADWLHTYFDSRDILKRCDTCERAAVTDRPSVAKLIVSPTYTRVKKLFLKEIVENIIIEAYKHDACDEEELSSSDNEECGEDEEDEEDNSETDEGIDEGSEPDSSEEGGDEAFD